MIEPVLKSLAQIPLFVGAMLLTAVNDNAAITYLATLVSGVSPLGLIAGALAPTANTALCFLLL